MLGSLTIRKGRLVLPDRVVTGDILVEDGVIAEIGPAIARTCGEEIDGAGLTVLPGAIDPQVHFRDPSDNPTEDLATGSRAAAAGGVTAFLDMPNNDPVCTTVERLQAKLDRAAANSVVHYGFFIGAPPNNIDELNAAERACGIKIFMGSSTGDLLVNDPNDIEQIFMAANKPIAVHAEDEARLRERKVLYEGTTDPNDHPRIRDAEAALLATRQAVEFSLKHGQRLHILHMTSAEEVDYLRTVPRDNITCEVCPQHLFMHAEDAYDTLGTRAQCNPPVRTRRHARALWHGLLDGVVQCIATDHAPHPLHRKSAGYPNTPSGMPGVEWSLPLMLDQVQKGNATLNQVARWMCEAPARCYSIPRKGRLETGYDGDIVLVDMTETRTITDESTRSGCGWTPYAGWEVTGWPVLTAVMGRPVYRDGEIIEGVRGRELTYARS